MSEIDHQEMLEDDNAKRNSTWAAILYTALSLVLLLLF